MNSPEPDEALKRALADWRIAPRRDPQFRAAVWTEIRGTARGMSWSGFVRAHAAFVAGIVAAAVITGGWIGRDRAQARADADRAAIATSYVRAMDARAMRMP